MKDKQSKLLRHGDLVKIKRQRGKHRLWRYVITPKGVEGWMVTTLKTGAIHYYRNDQIKSVAK